MGIWDPPDAMHIILVNHSKNIKINHIDLLFSNNILLKGSTKC